MTCLPSDPALDFSTLTVPLAFLVMGTASLLVARFGHFQPALLCFQHADNLLFAEPLLAHCVLPASTAQQRTVTL